MSSLMPPVSTGYSAPRKNSRAAWWRPVELAAPVEGIFYQPRGLPTMATIGV